MKRRVYLSGKITGLDTRVAKANFKKAATEVLGFFPGQEVVNPMEAVPYEIGKEWLDYMLDDIALLRGCQVIWRLPDWKESEEAKIEHAIALKLGILIIYSYAYSRLMGGDIIQPQNKTKRGTSVVCDLCGKDPIQAYDVFLKLGICKKCRVKE